jgi:hypothetical protein
MVWRLYVDIYEEGNELVVVRHVFEGHSRSEAQRYFNSHVQTDEFLRLCITRGRWRDVRCRAVKYWRRGR